LHGISDPNAVKSLLDQMMKNVTTQPTSSTEETKESHRNSINTSRSMKLHQQSGLFILSSVDWKVLIKASKTHQFKKRRKYFQRR